MDTWFCIATPVVIFTCLLPFWCGTMSVEKALASPGIKGTRVFLLEKSDTPGWAYAKSSAVIISWAGLYSWRSAALTHSIIFVLQGDAPLPLRNKSKIQVPNAMPLVFSCPPPHGGGSEAVQRPSESLKVLIAQAMAQRADRSMMVGEIYQRIKDKHAFYRNQAEASWQSSIRHCLTINKCFVKTPKQHVDPAQKGACWTMVTDGDPALQQLLDEQRTTPAALLQQPSQTNPMFAAALAQVAAAAAGQQPGGGMGMQAPQILQGMAGLQGFQGFQGNAQLQQMLQIQQLQQLQQLQLAYGAQQGGEHAGFGQLQGAMRQAFDMARALAANAAATNSAATNVARTAVPDTMTLPVSGVGTYSDANDDENDDDEDAENGDSDDADADAGMVIDDE